ncbi:MAG TPA: hypothetical protein PK263_02280 [bacterium]|mgnify:CR=1 FL=1|nr:hypothetical protein [bacterium]
MLESFFKTRLGKYFFQVLVSACLVVAAVVLQLPGEKDTARSKANDGLITAEILDQGIEPEKMYLYASGDNEGFGISRRIFTNSDFILTVSATLPKLDSPEHYFVWAILPESDQASFVNLGQLTYYDGDFFLVYQSKDNLDQYYRIVVSRESGSAPESPGELVLDGKF